MDQVRFDIEDIVDNEDLTVEKQVERVMRVLNRQMAHSESFDVSARETARKRIAQIVSRAGTPNDTRIEQFIDVIKAMKKTYGIVDGYYEEKERCEDNCKNCPALCSPCRCCGRVSWTCCKFSTIFLFLMVLFIFVTSGAIVVYRLVTGK